MTQSKKSNLHEDLTFGSYPPRPSVVNITKLEKLFSVWLQQFTEDGNFLKEEFGDSPVQIKGKEDRMSFRFTTDFYIRVSKLTEEQEEKVDFDNFQVQSSKGNI